MDEESRDPVPRKHGASDHDELATARAAGLARMTRRQALRAGLGLVTTATFGGALAACANSTASRTLATPVPAATESPDPTATPDTRPVTVAITGDIMLARAVNTRMLSMNDRFPFNYTADYLRTFDLTVGNLECVVSTLGSPQPKEFVFEANPRGFERLAAAGFDIVSVANNHSGDYGKTAFMDMLAHLPAHGITPVGGGANLRAAHTPVIREVRGTRVGILAYCEIGPETFAATATTPGHAWLDPALMSADIRRTRPLVDYLVVFTHWGIEYQLQQTEHQVAMAHAAIDAGADFVVGAHPHVRQPSETYRGKPIVYSLGNFVFDEMPGVEESQGNVLCLTLRGRHLLHWKLRTARIVGPFGEPRWE